MPIIVNERAPMGLIVNERPGMGLFVNERSPSKLIVSSPGPQGRPGRDADFASAEFENVATVPISAGVPVRRSGSGVVHADLNHPAIGVAVKQAAPGEACNVLISGFLTIPGWGLVPGNIYYLGIGALEITPPSMTGQFVQRIGTAMSFDTLAVLIEQPVRL